MLPGAATAASTNSKDESIENAKRGREAEGANADVTSNKTDSKGWEQLALLNTLIVITGVYYEQDAFAADERMDSLFMLTIRWCTNIYRLAFHMCINHYCNEPTTLSLGNRYHALTFQCIVLSFTHIVAMLSSTFPESLSYRSILETIIGVCMPMLHSAEKPTGTTTHLLQRPTREAIR